jgi:hypothetical protein
MNFLDTQPRLKIKIPSPEGKLQAAGEGRAGAKTKKALAQLSLGFPE